MRVQATVNRFLKFSLLLVGLSVLQGCVSAAMSGAQAVYNRHDIQKNLTDEYITLQVYRILNIDYKKDFQNGNISIVTYNRIVLLAGQVPEKWQQAKIGTLVKNIPNVKQVYNLITISPPSSALTRVSDAWITAKIKSKFIASEEVDPTNIKVVTENGTVYLLGILTPEEAHAAVAFARTTEGVQDVVKVFEYIRITKT